MSKRDTLQKIFNAGTYLAGAYFVGIAIAGYVKRKREKKQQEQQSHPAMTTGVGKVPGKFKHFVYGYEIKYPDGTTHIGDYVFASSHDAENYVCNNIKKDLEINYTQPMNALTGWYIVTDKQSGDIVAEIHIKNFFYHE